MIRVLVVDDEEPLRRLLKKELARRGFSTETAATGEEALGMLEEGEFHVMLLDITMPGMDGIGVLQRLKDIEQPPAVIVLTGNATIETAVNAMKHGAYDYLTKPCKLDELEIVLSRAYEFDRLSRKSEILEQELIRCTGSSPDIVAQSPGMQDVLALVSRVAPTDSTVLISGQSGTGKELVASQLWKMSARSEEPYMVLNCATLSGQLIESELFGHEKGAFTTAYKTKFGIVEAADNGTLFLDEIGELPLELQAKFLRFLDAGEFRRVGSTRTLRADVRVIAASNRNLRAMVEEGGFREDLFYRLNVINVHIPPLCTRREDIIPLAELFLKRQARKISKDVTALTPEAAALLEGYAWPGNVRELENEMERAVVLCNSREITPEDLTAVLRDAQSTTASMDDPPAEAMPELEEMEKQYIMRVLKQTAGNQSRASEILGINRKTLYLKLRKYGISPEETA